MRRGSRYLGWILAGSIALLFSAISPVTGQTTAEVNTTAAVNGTDYIGTTTRSSNNGVNDNTASSSTQSTTTTVGAGSTPTSTRSPAAGTGETSPQLTSGSTAPTSSAPTTTTPAPAPSNSNVSTTAAPTPIWCRQCNATNNCTWPDTNNATTECRSTSGICYVLLDQTNVTNQIMSLSCHPSKSTANTCSSDVIGTPTNVGAFYEFCCKKPDCNDDKTMAELNALCIPSAGKSGAGHLQVGWSLGQVSLVLAITLALTSVFRG